jgi:hypothetical protein
MVDIRTAIPSACIQRLASAPSFSVFSATRHHFWLSSFVSFYSELPSSVSSTTPNAKELRSYPGFPGNFGGVGYFWHHFDSDSFRTV